jgi:hypothetical protein
MMFVSIDGRLSHPPRLHPPRNFHRIKPPYATDPYGRQLTRADPISERDLVKAEEIADLSDGEQAGTRE